MRDGFTFFSSYYKAAKGLPAKQRLALYDAIIAYGLEEEEIELSGTPEALFELIKPVIAKGKAKAQAGAKGGKANAKQNESKTEANTKQNGSDKDKDKELNKDEDINTPPISPKGDGAPAPSESKPKQGGSKATEPVKKPYGEFQNVMLTDEEYSKLSATARGLIEEMSCYIKSGGKGYKSHYAALLNWERRRRKDRAGGMHVNGNDSFTADDLSALVEEL